VAKKKIRKPAPANSTKGSAIRIDRGWSSSAVLMPSGIATPSGSAWPGALRRIMFALDSARRRRRRTRSAISEVTAGIRKMPPRTTPSPAAIEMIQDSTLRAV
jgi:hypothetical protein